MILFQPGLPYILSVRTGSEGSELTSLTRTRAVHNYLGDMDWVDFITHSHRMLGITEANWGVGEGIKARILLEPDFVSLKEHFWSSPNLENTHQNYLNFKLASLGTVIIKEGKLLCQHFFKTINNPPYHYICPSLMVLNNCLICIFHNVYLIIDIRCNLNNISIKKKGVKSWFTNSKTNLQIPVIIYF